MRSALVIGVALAVLLANTAAAAQRRPKSPQGQGGTQSGPVQTRTVGPRPQQPGDDTGDRPLRAEPILPPVADPLEVPPLVQEKIGSDSDEPPTPLPATTSTRSYFPTYQESEPGYRFRLLPPLLLEHTRRTPDPDAPKAAPEDDHEALYGMLFYRRRSKHFDADVLFPLAWRVRDHATKAWVLGPAAHREAPHEHDNWLAPLVFEGERASGGYFHSPLLLTTSHWGRAGAFTLAGPYFRDRTEASVDWGVFPLFFRGDSGDREGARRTYTLVPPLLYYHRERELDDNKLTVVGPLVFESTPKRSIFDVMPLFFHIEGKPETGGIRESHTTLFPFFHYGHAEDRSLFVIPGYLRRITKRADAMLTPLYSRVDGRGGATRFTALGPVVPVYFNYRDRDLGFRSWAILPLFYHETSPAGTGFLTPLVGRFENYGVSKTWWLFPSFTLSTDARGWESNLHPLLYLGRNGGSSHTVIAPFFWDFANPEGRTTVGFPFYWRFSDNEAKSVTQVAGNTVYVQRKVPGGIDWQFHVAPLFSYGENPLGYWWNVLFGLAGYEREGRVGRAKAFWVPFQVAGP